MKNVARLINALDLSLYVCMLVLVTQSMKLFDWGSVPDTCSTACATYQ